MCAGRIHQPEDAESLSPSALLFGVSVRTGSATGSDGGYAQTQANYQSKGEPVLLVPLDVLGGHNATVCPRNR